MSRDHLKNGSELVIREDAQNGEGARKGVPAGFFTKVEVQEEAQVRIQAVIAQPVAATEQQQAGGEQTTYHQHLSRRHLVEMLPELPRPARVMRSGRPTVMTPQVKEQLCLMLSLGLSRRQAASYLDIDHSTITHAAERDPDFARGLAKAEDLRVAEPLLHIVGTAAQLACRRFRASIDSAAASTPPSCPTHPQTIVLYTAGRGI
jgi:hypothetical protein